MIFFIFFFFGAFVGVCNTPLLSLSFFIMYYPIPLPTSSRDTIHEIRDTSLGFAKAHYYSYNYKKFI